jgi:hypothetical protein
MNEAFEKWWKIKYKNLAFSHHGQFVFCGLNLEEAYEAGQNQRDEEVEDITEEKELWRVLAGKRAITIDSISMKEVTPEGLGPELLVDDDQGDWSITYKQRAENAEARVNDLKRKLFLEGVKNNSDKARVEFLEDKQEAMQPVLDAARNQEVVHWTKMRQVQQGETAPCDCDTCTAIRVLDRTQKSE